MKIGIDVGGVLSKYPDFFRKLFRIFDDYYCTKENTVEIHIISDMHPKEKIISMLEMNGFYIPPEQIHSADYANYGEQCKMRLCKELNIDVLIDDFIGYVADGDNIRLLVMPNSTRPYYAPEWKTDGSEGDFGRRACRTKQ